MEGGVREYHEEKLFIFHNRTKNWIFLTVCRGIVIICGSPSMRRPCRMTAELPSVAILPSYWSRL